MDFVPVSFWQQYHVLCSSHLPSPEINSMSLCANNVRGAILLSLRMSLLSCYLRRNGINKTVTPVPGVAVIGRLELVVYGFVPLSD